MLVKIGEAAAQYKISNRTLRYWEEEGILKSIRMENGYRYFNEESILKIKQIMMLRKLRLPIQDIQRIFVSKELSCAVEVLQHHLEDTKQEAEQLEALAMVMERLIHMVEMQNDIKSIFQYLDVPDNSAILELKKALQITLSERDNNMTKQSSYSTVGDIRIIKLPKMTIASYGAISETPENDCWKVVNKLVEDYSLQDCPGFRHFGFNNPDPTPGKAEYGYEMWVVVPENLPIPEPFVKKEFAGGLYGALPTYMTVIGERWGQLFDWVQTNDSYELDVDIPNMRHELEECMDYVAFNSEATPVSEKQLDLLLPIKRIDKVMGAAEAMTGDMLLELKPKRVALPDITLGGCEFAQKENAKPWKIHTPWYLLAQTIYKSGKDCMKVIKAGNNTFTLIYGESVNKLPFYLADKHGVPRSAFCAVEITAPFESYPDSLKERILNACEYLVFSLSVPAEKATSKPLPKKKLYDAALQYITAHSIKTNPDYCLEREYRADGRKVDKVELYIPLL